MRSILSSCVLVVLVVFVVGGGVAVVIVVVFFALLLPRWVHNDCCNDRWQLMLLCLLRLKAQTTLCFCYGFCDCFCNGISGFFLFCLVWQKSVIESKSTLIETDMGMMEN